MGSLEQFVQPNGVKINISSYNSPMAMNFECLSRHVSCSAHVTFSLNALAGRKREEPDDEAGKKMPDSDDKAMPLMVGKWDHRNAYDLMEYTASKGYKIDSYELGKRVNFFYIDGPIFH